MLTLTKLSILTSCVCKGKMIHFLRPDGRKIGIAERSTKAEGFPKNLSIESMGLLWKVWSDVDGVCIIVLCSLIRKKYGFIVICNGCTSKAKDGQNMNTEIIQKLYKYFVKLIRE